jgi:tripartite-type tricarboxylate transporter receptor subunit TctC
MNTCTIAFSVASALLVLLGVTDCSAEDAASYPSQNIKIIVPFPAGGTADTLPRIVAEKLRQKWKQPVIVENRSGAGGNIGADAVASSAPDGYTLLASPPGPIAINENLYKKLSFRPQYLMPITVLGTAPNVLDVRPDFPAKTVKELIDYAKANPEKITFASQGNGTTSHLTAVLFEKLTGTRMVHVPSAPPLPCRTSWAIRSMYSSTISVHR